VTPAERLAFVLHDMFGVPFEQIATIIDRSPQAARQLASRARRRVRAQPTTPDADMNAQPEGSLTPSWPRRARATSTRWSPPSTPTSCCEPTAARHSPACRPRYAAR
jgi:hypothetical protein